MNNRDFTLQRLLAVARETPGATALVALEADPEGGPGAVRTIPWTLGDLVRRAQRLARGLIRRGAEPGSRVAIVSRSRAEWVLVDLACQLAGLVLVPLFRTELPANLRRSLELTACRFAIAEDPWQMKKLIEASEGLAWEVELILIDDRILLHHGGELNFAELGGRKPMMLRDVTDLGAATGQPDILDERNDSIDADACTAVSMTADDDGELRGVMVTHGNLTAAATAYAERLRELLVMHRVKAKRHLLGLSFTLPIGRTALWASLIAGIPVASLRTSSSLAEDCRAFRPTFATLAPAVLEKARVGIERELRHGRGLRGLVSRWALDADPEEGLIGKARRGIRLARLRKAATDRLGDDFAFAVAAGAQAGVATAEFFHDARVVVREAYGTPETIGFTHIDMSAPPSPQSIGAPLTGIDHKVGHDGELFVRGEAISPGYWRDAAATATVLGADGWLATGDLADRQDGQLRITGRKRDVIVLSDGRAVAPRRLERALICDELISEALVHGENRPFLVALIVLERHALGAFAHAQSLKGTPESWSRDTAVYARIDAAVRSANSQQPAHAQIRKFAILRDTSANEPGEICMTNNLRRGLVERKHHSLLETFYAESF